MPTMDVFLDEKVKVASVLRLTTDSGCSLIFHGVPKYGRPYTPPYMNGKERKLACEDVHTRLNGHMIVMVGYAYPILFGIKNLELLDWRVVRRGHPFSEVVYARVPATTFTAHEYDVRDFWKSIRLCDVHTWWDHRANREGCPDCIEEEIRGD